MNLEMRAGARQWEYFAGYMGSHRGFYSRDALE